ncbi:MAG: peptidyl-prolyl cis-trans isomerase [Polyangiaceae bacterium]|nr:peptidyl-prolyl cis-trans isomerase [Polyangiaceae bacterium]
MARYRSPAMLAPLLTALALGGLASCDEEPLKPRGTEATSTVGGLTPEQASRVLAKVGDKTITLGDFAQTLERMDQFDRLRYQTKERRRELLNEIVDAELLAQEAKRRGLDKLPESEDAVRQILRDAILAQARAAMPVPTEIPASEVRAYYEAHAERFSEPERRRVAAIVLDTKADAEKVLKAAAKIKNATEWGQLFFEHSITAPKTKPANAPLETAGDLGIVGPPDDKRGGNPKVPEPIRAAVFRLGSVGQVANEVIRDGNRYYVVRMNGLTAAHHRSLAEADRTIRIALMQEKMQKIERDLEEGLRRKFPVEINEKALANVKLPPALEKIDLSSGPSPQSYEEAAAWAARDAGTEGDAGAAEEAPKAAPDDRP